jgi:hypothetical protein
MTTLTRRSALLIGAVCGAGIWLLSPLLARHAEPWDGAAGYYPGALFLTGFVSSLMVPGVPGTVALGIFIGQALVLLGRVVAHPAQGGLWPLGIFFLGPYTLVALLGAVVGSAVGRRIGRRGQRRPDEA